MPGIIPLLIVLLLAFLLFARPGRLSTLMEDMGRGIRGFRKGLGDGERDQQNAQQEPPAQVTQTPQQQPRETDRA
ncbi:MAG: twin-arginine translocase TatA/TatE family subunit [Hyphomonadaceae bacterium]